jgi:hypothetical protein
MKRIQAAYSFIAGWNSALVFIKASPKVMQQANTIMECFKQSQEHLDKLPKRQRRFYKKP